MSYFLVLHQVCHQKSYGALCCTNCLLSNARFLIHLFHLSLSYTAILFGKIARVQSIATVRFSHPIAIRYGTGVIGTGDNDCEGEDDEEDEDEDYGNAPIEKGSHMTGKWPCPVLEFRIVNELSEQMGGEIMNATVNVAVSNIESMVLPGALEKAVSGRIGKNARKRAKGGIVKSSLETTTDTLKQTGKALLGGTRGAALATGNLIQQLHHTLTKPMHPQVKAEEGKPYNSESEQEIRAQFAREVADSVRESQTVTVDEGGGKLAPRRIYSRLVIETDSHPFFKRVWNIRHVLNQDSPILTPRARRKIIENGGFWPAELTNHTSVRDHIHFEQLFVSLSGTSNVSGAAVYAQNLYDYEQLLVGYALAPMLGHDDSGHMIVDHQLLNDVREQHGGGGEPIEESFETAAESAQRVEQLNKSFRLD